jgi:hypothetical protein
MADIIAFAVWAETISAPVGGGGNGAPGFANISLFGAGKVSLAKAASE